MDIDEHVPPAGRMLPIHLNFSTEPVVIEVLRLANCLRALNLNKQLERNLSALLLLAVRGGYLEMAVREVSPRGNLKECQRKASSRNAI